MLLGKLLLVHDAPQVSHEAPIEPVEFSKPALAMCPVPAAIVP
jgi:hypothetical protein